MTTKPRAVEAHMTFDNFFCDDRIMNYLGSKGLAATMTMRRDHLPKEIPKEYLCKDTPSSKSQKT